MPPNRRRSRAVGLRKRFEDELELFLRDADPGIANHEVQQSERRIDLLAHHLQHHFAFAGEFDCVADQIENHLAQPCRICIHHPRHTGVDVEEQPQVFLLRREGPSISAIVCSSSRRSKSRSIEIQLARFHLRKIENVVDQA